MIIQIIALTTLDMITRKKGILFIEKEIADFSEVAAELPENSEIEKLQKIDGKHVQSDKNKASKSSKNTTKEMLHRALFVKAENSSSDSENEMVFVDDSDLDIDMEDCTADKDEISVDDFILVEFLGKRVRKYFAGEVKEDTSEGYVVTFLWRKSPSCNFVFLEVVDESLVPKSDIVMKLLVPRVRGD
ncbi:hypothetical protein QYM36_006691 [Artemia franciscana]|uniref:Uncharacterized protein n=1 Tax=Artemia franciscana TaxID=6661 RepID=A0AA88HZA4_ARTSF|nr:hypothetical protein QYM36_006691 [Artemia franciscana]